MIEDGDNIIDCMARMVGDNTPFALATVVRTEDATAAKAGAKAVVRADGALVGWIGGTCAEGPVRKAAAQALVDGRPRLIRVRPAERDAPGEEIDDFISACPSGGTLDIFIEPVLPRPAVVVVGASPVARALCALAKGIGYAVTVAAPERDLDAFAEADRRVAGFDLGAVPRMGTSFVVVATQGRRDLDALAAAMASEAPYVAFVASRRKAAAMTEALQRQGLAPDRLARLRAPAGLAIGAATAGEIALAVLADIVREHRAGAPRTAPWTAPVPEAPSQAPAADCCHGDGT
jgi:xanthine dehydrogenase accessory factor